MNVHNFSEARAERTVDVEQSLAVCRETMGAFLWRLKLDHVELTDWVIQNVQPDTLASVRTIVELA